MNTDRSKQICCILCDCLVLVLLYAVSGIAGAQPGPDSPKQIELNSATAEELDKLPEVGPKLAKAIVEFREKSGPFRRVEDLLAIPGISKRRLEEIRPHVYIAPPKRASGSAPPAAALS